MQESKFQFLNPYLEEIYFKVNSEFKIQDSEFEMENSFNVQVKRSSKENRANVGLVLEVNANAEKAPFTLKAKVSSDFQWDSHLDDDIVDSLLNMNAPALLLSYMRPIVANVTNTSMFPTYNLPFINFTNK